MFVKLQLDAKCFPVLSSANASPIMGVSFSALETQEKQRGRKVLEIPSTEKGSFAGVQKQRQSRSQSAVVLETVIDKAQEKKNYELNGDDRKDLQVNGTVEELHANCSMKWMNYGGCLPAILRALDTIKDLDEAFKPWEERLSSKERSIILKEQTSWERALEIFEWFKRKRCYELNIIHYNIMLRVLGKAREWRQVERLWDEISGNGITPINSTYGTLIDVYSKGGQRNGALIWLGKMTKQGMEPDEVTMGTVVQMYKKAGEFLKAEDFFKKWSLGESLRLRVANTENSAEALQENVRFSPYTYNTLIDTYGKAGQLLEASKTFKQMLSEGIVPTTVTFNTMIHICGNNGQLLEVDKLLQKMEELRCLPDTRTYNVLISLHTKHDKIDTATSYFEKMKVANLKPDAVTYRSLLYAYSIRCMVHEAESLVVEMDETGFEIDEYTQTALIRMYIDAGLLEKSWLWFRRFHLAGSMSSECYSANIDAYGGRGHVLEAERAFFCCLEQKKLTVLEFNVMIKAYGLANNYDNACQLFDTMTCHGIVPDRCSYNSIIQILASANLPHRAKPYLRKMQEVGLVQDCIPYCAVICSYVKLGKLETAEKLYREMIHWNVQPDVIVYGVLINAFADAGCYNEALSYVDALKEAGLPANTVIYKSLIKLYTKVSCLREAQETYRLIQQSGVGSDIYTSNCMIDLYTERSMVEDAEEIFQRLKSNGEANEFTFAMMLCMYRRIGKIEQALRIAKHMRESKLMSDLLSYNNLLGLYALDGRVRDAVGTFKEMIEAGMQPDDCTYKSLGSILIKCGLSRQAVAELEVDAKRDAQSGLKAWSSALAAVVEIQFRQDCPGCVVSGNNSNSLTGFWDLRKDMFSLIPGTKKVAS